MTPREELASFLATRGHCLTDNGRLAEAVQAYGWASAVVPDDRRYNQIYAHMQQKYLAAQEREIALVLETNRRNRERQDLYRSTQIEIPRSNDAVPSGIDGMDSSNEKWAS
jgi:hypothetical protein